MYIVMINEINFIVCVFFFSNKKMLRDERNLGFIIIHFKTKTF